MKTALGILIDKYGPPDDLETSTVAMWNQAGVKLVIHTDSYEVSTPDAHFEVQDLADLEKRMGSPR